MAAEAQRATRLRGQNHFAYTPPAVVVANALGRLDAAELRLIASTAIDLLDQRAGDCDLEDDDPAGDTLDEHGEHPCDDGFGWAVAA